MRLAACHQCHCQFDVTVVEAATFRCPCGAVIDCAPRAPVDAEVHRCGSCGALLAGEPSACAYCGAGVVRDPRRLRLLCPECYARNSESARYCTSCGVEFRPQAVPGSDDSHECPVCDEPMRARSISGLIVEECEQCSGLWVPGDGFDALVTRALHTSRAKAVSVSLKRRVRGHFQSQVVYRPCPVCESPMQRKNFARRSGVIVDWCGNHGTWLDADELEHIAAFVLNGGLRGERGTVNAGWGQPGGQKKAAPPVVTTLPVPEAPFEEGPRPLIESLGDFLVRLLS